MEIQTSGDDRREIAVEQTRIEPAKIAEQLKDLFWPNMPPANKAVLQAAIHALLSPPPATVYCLPPPITEADGYRLNTSWHSGAIFRDGANWMLEQAKQMQPTLVITLPDTGSKAFWHGSGKSEVFLPAAYQRWVKEAIERHCAMARIEVEVK